MHTERRRSVLGLVADQIFFVVVPHCDCERGLLSRRQLQLAHRKLKRSRHVQHGVQRQARCVADDELLLPRGLLIDWVVKVLEHQGSRREAEQWHRHVRDGGKVEDDALSFCLQMELPTLGSCTAQDARRFACATAGNLRPQAQLSSTCSAAHRLARATQQLQLLGPLPRRQ